jgi:outer membrane protein assembly factor BamB
MGSGSSTRTTAIGDCLVRDGSLLVSADSEIHVIEARTGRVRQQLQLRGCNLAKSALVDDRLAVSGYDGGAFVAAYDLTAERELWRRAVPVSTGTVSATKGIMVFATDHHFHGVDLETGNELWSFSVADLGRHDDPDTERLEPGRVAGRPPVIVGDQMLGGVVGHHLISLDLRSGALRWARRIPMRRPAALTYDPAGRLYAIDSARLVSVDVEHGGVIASEHAIRGEVDRMSAARAHFGPWSKLAVTERFVYFGTKAALIALDKSRGTAEWMQPTESTVPPDGGPVAVGQRLYAVDLAGNLQVFEPVDRAP